LNSAETRVARSLHHVIDVAGAALEVSARDDNGMTFDRVALAGMIRYRP
jgi:hypothetical protein